MSTTTVEVRRVKNKSYPCNKCRYFNNHLFPKTKVHAVHQLGMSYLQNLKAGGDQPYITIVGLCSDYQEKT